MEWSKYFYDMANLVAKKSKDQSTQIGAVIVGPDNEILHDFRIIVARKLPLVVFDEFELFLGAQLGIIPSVQ